MIKKNIGTVHYGWVLYILICRGDRLYTGISNDLQGRLKAHEEGRGSKFVRAFSPFTLAEVVPCKNGTAARKLECRVKKMKRSEKLDFVKAYQGEYAVKRQKGLTAALDISSPGMNSGDSRG